MPLIPILSGNDTIEDVQTESKKILTEVQKMMLKETRPQKKQKWMPGEIFYLTNARRKHNHRNDTGLEKI